MTSQPTTAACCDLALRTEVRRSGLRKVGVPDLPHPAGVVAYPVAGRPLVPGGGRMVPEVPIWWEVRKALLLTHCAFRPCYRVCDSLPLRRAVSHDLVESALLFRAAKGQSSLKSRYPTA